MPPNFSNSRINIESAKELSRQFRKSPTEAELFFWNRVRKKRFLGLRFIRQHPIFFQYYKRESFFIADFYCHDQKLVVEIDGPIHKRQHEEDKFRDFIIDTLGIRVLRFKNEEVMDNINNVLKRIATVIQSPISPIPLKKPW